MRFIQAFGLVALATSVSALPKPWDPPSGSTWNAKEWRYDPPATTTAAAVAATASVAVDVPAVSASASVAVDVPTAAATPSASATPSTGANGAGGSITIINKMKQTIYLWSVGDTVSDMHTLPTGENYSETWYTKADGGGPSIKMATVQQQENVLQFEYTLPKDKSPDAIDSFFYDTSSIDLFKNPAFIAAGFKVESSDPACPTIHCAAGDSTCAESYQLPFDVRTLACKAEAAYTMTVGV